MQKQDKIPVEFLFVNVFIPWKSRKYTAAVILTDFWFFTIKNGISLSYCI